MRKFKILICFIFLFLVSSCFVFASDDIATANLLFDTGTIPTGYEIGFSRSAITDGSSTVVPVNSDIALDLDPDNSTGATVIGINNSIWVYWKVVYPTVKMDLKLRTTGPLVNEGREIDWKVYKCTEDGKKSEEQGSLLIDSSANIGVSSTAGEGTLIFSKNNGVFQRAESQRLYIEASLDISGGYGDYLASPYKANLIVEMVTEE